MSWNWLIAGGDRRALRLAEKLKQNGWQVQTLGLSEGDEQTARPEQADAILLPYPWSARGGLIPTLTGLTLHPENVLRQASPGTLVLAVSTNDGLGIAAQNIGRLMAWRSVYFVPFRQDDPVKKPRSLVADFAQIPKTLASALCGVQLQPMLAQENRVGNGEIL